MRLVIIGSGNVATVLGRKLVEAGHEILQVFGRDADNATSLADRLGTSPCLAWQDIRRDADAYLAAVSDSSLPGLSIHLRLGNRLIMHTAGSVNAGVLQEISSSFGVLYPLQTLKKDRETQEEIPFLIDGNSEQTREVIRKLALSVSSNVSMAGDEERKKIHLAATIVNNFSNHLFASAYSFCQCEGLDFSVLLPLIRQTAIRAGDGDPAKMQTGPAIRGDFATVSKHEEMLDNYPGLKKLYQMFSENIAHSRR